MGQAFDREGNVLDEQYGATKQEVFDKLNLRFKDAHEIRIRSMEQSAASSEMPRYKSHKVVWALKIADIYSKYSDELGTNLTMIQPADEGYAAFPVGDDYMEKHKPTAGGYYVVYKDGYKSFSPADAFEDGYTRL